MIAIDGFSSSFWPVGYNNYICLIGGDLHTISLLLADTKFIYDAIKCCCNKDIWSKKSTG